MRKEFITTLLELASENENIFLLTGDLGFSFLEEFRQKFPDRFFNIGVAEANMVSIAAGLALSGKIVFIYSIVPFVTMRPFEFIRNDISYQNLNVKIVGVGGGLCYGSAGMTHHSIEDIAIMRAIPNMTIVCPGDPVEAELAARLSVSYEGPVYIRLGKGNEPRVHLNVPNCEIGKAITIKNGDDVTIIAMGNILYNAKEATDKLTEEGISVRLISMWTIKPIDKDIVLKAAQETKAIFTIEEHGVIGGLGSAVAEVIAESNNRRVLFKRVGIRNQFCDVVGSQDYLRSIAGLDIEGIINQVRENARRSI